MWLSRLVKNMDSPCARKRRKAAPVAVQAGKAALKRTREEVDTPESLLNRPRLSPSWDMSITVKPPTDKVRSSRVVEQESGEHAAYWGVHR